MSSETGYRDIDRRARVLAKAIKYTVRPVEERILDFEEAIQGYLEEDVVAEAARCVQCPEPQACMLRCPAGNDVPEALWLVSQRDFIGAAKVFAATSPLPEVCGRVCPNICQDGCGLMKGCGSISVGKVEAWVTSYARQYGVMAIEVPEEKTGKQEKEKPEDSEKKQAPEKPEKPEQPKKPKVPGPGDIAPG